MIRVATSLPMRSVPKGCSQVGPCIRMAMLGEVVS